MKQGSKVTMHRTLQYFVALIVLAIGTGVFGLYPTQTAWAQADQGTTAEEFSGQR